MTTNGSAGFTYVEVLLAVVILAGGATSLGFALQQVRAQQDGADAERTADLLLQDGLAWVQSLPRLEPTGPVFGAEPGETAVDDVDDLDGLLENGPIGRAGDAFATDWQRQWRVRSVTLADPTAPAVNGSTSLLSVQCSIRRLGNEVAQATVLLARTP